MTQRILLEERLMTHVAAVGESAALSFTIKAYLPGKNIWKAASFYAAQPSSNCVLCHGKAVRCKGFTGLRSCAECARLGATLRHSICLWFEWKMVLDEE